MNRFFTRTIQLFIIFSDFTGVLLASLTPLLFYQNESKNLLASNFIVLFGGIWVLISLNTKLYQLSTILSPGKYYRKTLQTTLLFIFFLVIIRMYVFHVHNLLFEIYSFTILVLWILCFRFVYDRYRIYLKKNGKRLNRIIVIGLNDTSRKLVYFLRENHFNHDILAILAEKGTNIQINDYPVYPLNLSKLQSFVNKPINEIYSTLTPIEIRKHFNLSNYCRNHGIRLHWVNRFSESIPYPVYLNNRLPYGVYSELREPLLLPESKFVKRSFDILVSSFLIIFCLSWMIPIIGLAITLESRGPIFFRQRRTGTDNQTFYCLKFRTMKMNDHADQKQAVKNDTRVTRFGKFLRHSSLDEFPQLINVFWGDMSIVGPRPHMLKHTEDYSSTFGSYRVRHYVKPGITGWAQINGCRGEISDSEQLKARIVRDLWYIENWSLGLDLKIIWMTFYKMIRGDKNAY